MGGTDWRDTKYQETLEEELRFIQRRRESDPSCTIADLKGIVTHLYHIEGADWGGRGEVQDVILSATIAAYESVLAQWEADMLRDSR